MPIKHSNKEFSLKPGCLAGKCLEHKSWKKGKNLSRGMKYHLFKLEYILVCLIVANL